MCYMLCAMFRRLEHQFEHPGAAWMEHTMCIVHVQVCMHSANVCVCTCSSAIGFRGLTDESSSLHIYLHSLLPLIIYFISFLYSYIYLFNIFFSTQYTNSHNSLWYHCIWSRSNTSAKYMLAWCFDIWMCVQSERTIIILYSRWWDDGRKTRQKQTEYLCSL